MAQNWDISLQQMWDFEKGFKKLKNPELARGPAPRPSEPSATTRRIILLETYETNEARLEER